VIDPGPHKLLRVRAQFVPRWKQMLFFLILRRVPVRLEVVDKA
jgi:hypothetical protein